MPKVKIVVNASPLIFLAKLERLDWLAGFQLWLPKAVERELFMGKRPEQDLIRNFCKAHRVTVKDHRKDRRTEFPPYLGEGEKAVIALALQQKIHTVFIDDHHARMIARSLGLRSKGTLGILLDQVHQRKVTKQEGKAIFQKFLKIGFRISEDLLIEVWKRLE